MNTILRAQADLIDDMMKFECTAGERYKTIADYTPPYGRGEGPTSLELFLSSLCSCVGGTLAVLLRQKDKTVEKISVQAQGNRRGQNPTCFDKIDICASIKARGINENEALEVLKVAEQSICPVTAMIRDKVELSCSLEIEN